MKLTSLCWDEWLALKCSESGPLLLPPSFLPSLSVDEPKHARQQLVLNTQRYTLDHTVGTSHACLGRCVCGMTSTGGEAVLNVLDTLCLVGVGEPVLAHVQVVAEADGATGHEDLGY